MRLLLAMALVLALGGCASPPERQSITVFAAASLTESFEQLATAFEQQNPEVDVVLNFGGSAGLAAQIAEGAPADVFAAAGAAPMEASGATQSTVFATNSLQIAVPVGNEARVSGLFDFSRPELAFAVCAVEVPCGSAAAELFAAEGVTPSIDTYEQDVKAVLTKVELGEVDAGLVYVTDVRAAGEQVEGILVDSAAVGYPIASVSERGATFVDFVLSTKGQAILAAAGFGAP